MNKISRMIVLATLFSLWAPPGSGYAAFYKYVDKEGGVHFTDRIESIPPEYRHQIKEYRDRQPSPAPGEDAGATEREKARREAERKKEAEEKARQEKAAREEKEKIYREKEKEIADLQEQVTQKQQEQRSLRTNWMVYDRIRLNQLNEEIAGLEKRIEEIKKDLPQ